VRVLWTDAAISQLQAIHDYIAQTSPEYALRIVDRLTKRSEQIANFPRSGRTVPEYELDEVRQIVEGSHRIIYWIKEAKNEIDVLAIVHTARGLLDLAGE
jgi:plasmid stabilization system protein ParE